MSNDEWYRCALGTSLGSFPDKKMQRSLPERQTEGKNRCLRLPRHTGHPQLKYGKASANTAWKTKSTRTPSLVSPYKKTGDSRFPPNLLPYTGVRAVFFGVTCVVVRKVYGFALSRCTKKRAGKLRNSRELRARMKSFYLTHFCTFFTFNILSKLQECSFQKITFWLQKCDQ